MREFEPKRIIKTHTQTLVGPPSEVFPLLCPTKEYDWIPHWKCDLVYSDSGLAELDCIFRTDFEKEGPPEVWVVDEYEPNRKIQFVRVNEIRAIRFTITLRANEDGTTHAEWRHVVTALNEEGNRYVDAYGDEDFAEGISSLERMINHYLTTGEMLRQPA